MECLLTMRRIYESERGDPRCSPRRGFVLSPKPGAPDVGGHKPFRLQPAGHQPRASTPFADSPAIAYQAVQQVALLVSWCWCRSPVSMCQALIAMPLVGPACRHDDDTPTRHHDPGAETQKAVVLP